MKFFTGIMMFTGVMLACLTSTAYADTGKFSFGVTGGLSDWTVEGDDDDGAGDDKGGSFGIAARYTVPVGARSFVGAHLGLQKESASGEDSERVLGSTIDTSVEVDSSADILARFGTDMGGFSPYVAAGLSVANGTVKVTADGATLFKDSATHVGWKVVLGTDVDLSESVTMFMQAEYADYGEEKYEDTVGSNTVYIEGEAKATAIRFGILYNF